LSGARELSLDQTKPSRLSGEGLGAESRGSARAATQATHLLTPTPEPSPTSLDSGPRRRGPAGGREE
jgi:hypothetical protein